MSDTTDTSNKRSQEVIDALANELRNVLKSMNYLSDEEIEISVAGFLDQQAKIHKLFTPQQES